MPGHRPSSTSTKLLVRPTDGNPDSEVDARSRSSTPEDAGRILVDFLEEVVDAHGRRHPVIQAEPEVAVPPIDRPDPVRLRVAQPCDRGPSPLAIRVVRVRRWPAFEDREMSRLDIDLDAQLVTDVRWHSRIAPPLDAGHAEVREAIRRHVRS